MDIISESNDTLKRLIEITTSRYKRFILKYKHLPVVSEITPFYDQLIEFLTEDLSHLTTEEKIKKEQEFQNEILDLLQTIENLEKQIEEGV